MASEKSTNDSARGSRRHNAAPRKGDRRRIELLDAAESLLTIGSLPHLTVERVAESAGMSRPSVYFYFESKRAIVDALIDRASNEMLEGFVTPSAGSSVAGFAAHVLQQTMIGWRSHLEVFLAAAELSSRADAATDRWRRIMDQFVDVMSRRLDEEGSRIDLRALGGSRGAAEICCWMVERNLYMYFARRPPAAEDAVVAARLVETMTRILRSPASVPDHVDIDREQ